MNTVALNRLVLPLNIACSAAGMLVYSYVAPGAPFRSTAIFSLGTFVCSFFLTAYVSRHLRNHSPFGADESDTPPLAMKLLFGLPPIFCGFEIAALLLLGATPDKVSWLHIAAAAAAGQNAEGAFKRK